MRDDLPSVLGTHDPEVTLNTNLQNTCLSICPYRMHGAHAPAKLLRAPFALTRFAPLLFACAEFL
jgi:hypothetical protein